MAFCGRCGRRLNENSNFCPDCGNKIIKINIPNVTVPQEVPKQQTLEGTPVQQKSEQPIVQYPPTISNQTIESGVQKNSVVQQERRTVFDGVVHKCPHCGSLMDALSVKCAACGYEVRNASPISTVAELSQRLVQLEESRTVSTKEAIAASFGLAGVDKTYSAKVSLITSFPIPNTKEDIVEFMVLASSNIHTDSQLQEASGNNLRTMQGMQMERNAWKVKMEQAYQKAKISFGNDPAFAQIQSIYDAKKHEEKKARTIGIVVALIILALSLGFLVFLFFI